MTIRLLLRLQRLLPPLPRLSLSLAFLLLSFGAAGCSGENPQGVAPPDGLFEPVALAATPSGRFLLVANGNFNRSFRAGTVVVLDTATSTIVPGARVEIGSFAGRMVVGPAGSDPSVSSAYVAVRENDSVTRIVVREEEGGGVSLECGQPEEPGLPARCSPDHEAVLLGEDGRAEFGEPFDLALVEAPPPEPEAPPDAPAGGEGELERTVRRLWVSYLRQGTVGVLPVREDGSLVTAKEAAPRTAIGRGTTALAVLPGGVFGVAASTASRSAALVEFRPPLEDVPAGLDVVRFLDLFGGGDTSGQEQVRVVRLSPDGRRLYAAARIAVRAGAFPGLLLVHDVVPGPDGLVGLDLVDEIPLPDMPSAIVVSPEGPGRPSLVYVLAFDANVIEVVDPATLRLVDVIRVDRGPFDMAIVATPAGMRGYVAGFRSGSVTVLDLQPGSPYFHRPIAVVR